MARGGRAPPALSCAHSSLSQDRIMGSFSIWHWIIVLVVVVLIFGTKKLKNLGKDLGEGIQGFKDGMKSPDDKPGQLGSERRDGTNADAERQDTPRKDA